MLKYIKKDFIYTKISRDLKNIERMKSISTKKRNEKTEEHQTKWSYLGKHLGSTEAEALADFHLNIASEGDTTIWVAY